MHILAMGTAYIVLMPVSIVFGLAGSRYHFPLQLLAASVASAGYFFSFLIRDQGQYNAHKGMGGFMMAVLAFQLACGLYKAILLRQKNLTQAFSLDNLGAFTDPNRHHGDGARNTISSQPPNSFLARLVAGGKALARVIVPPPMESPRLSHTEPDDSSDDGNMQEALAGTHPATWTRFQRALLATHKWVDIMSFVWGYMQIVLGMLATLNICYEPETARCVAHLIKGSILVGYGMIHVAIFRLGANWLRRHQQPIEYYESLFCILLGSAIVLLEHRPGAPWNHRDMQHISIGIIFLLGGLGAFLASKFRLLGANRTPLIALIYMFVGISMGFHHQVTEIASKVHMMFGVAFLTTALCRIAELAMLSQDPKATPVSMHPFQNLTAFFAMLSGYLLIGSTNGQMDLLLAHKIAVGSYGMLHCAFAFVTMTYTIGMMLLYEHVKGIRQPLSQNGNASDAAMADLEARTHANHTYFSLGQHQISPCGSSESVVAFQTHHAPTLDPAPPKAQ
ncbi:hypothetical protein H4R34_000695 [Dimargaris verticillata]|uniref:Integral membrane protein n=1 Tax=Dimargaris verticillata TaxID=2761393 RepID=A0A9W8B9W4_9FUNG|nr:hypothetical protein H4R34_000695 [Dimargaris verticillata]